MSFLQSLPTLCALWFWYSSSCDKKIVHIMGEYGRSSPPAPSSTPWTHRPASPRSTSPGWSDWVEPIFGFRPPWYPPGWLSLAPPSLSAFPGSPLASTEQRHHLVNHEDCRWPWHSCPGGNLDANKHFSTIVLNKSGKKKTFLTFCQGSSIKWTHSPCPGPSVTVSFTFSIFGLWLEITFIPSFPTWLHFSASSS